MHRLAVIVVLFVVVLGLAWDGLVIVLGKCAYGDTFCQAVRDLNADSQGCSPFARWPSGSRSSCCRGCRRGGGSSYRLSVVSCQPQRRQLTTALEGQGCRRKRSRRLALPGRFAHKPADGPSTSPEFSRGIHAARGSTPKGTSKNAARSPARRKPAKRTAAAKPRKTRRVNPAAKFDGAGKSIEPPAAAPPPRPKPRPTPMQRSELGPAAAEKISEAGREIGSPPPIADPQRRASAGFRLRLPTPHSPLPTRVLPRHLLPPRVLRRFPRSTTPGWRGSNTPLLAAASRWWPGRAVRQERVPGPRRRPAIGALRPASLRAPGRRHATPGQRAALAIKRRAAEKRFAGRRLPGGAAGRCGPARATRGFTPGRCAAEGRRGLCGAAIGSRCPTWPWQK